MTLLYEDDRAWLSTEDPVRYVLGDPDAPLLVLNDADEFGVMWACEEPAGWDSPVIVTPMDNRQDGHGGYAGESYYEPRTLTFSGSAAAPSNAEAKRARKRLLNAITSAVEGDPLLYTHIDDDPELSLWTTVVGTPKITIFDGRWLDFSFVLIAEDPIKFGPEQTYGPVRLLAPGAAPGLPTPLTTPLTLAGGSVVLTETRRNVVPNPRGTTLAAYGVAAGTTGVAAGSLLTGLTPVGATGLSTAARFTWTTAATAGGANIGPFYGSASSSGYAAPVAAGTTYSGSIFTRSSRAQTVQLHIAWYGADGTTLVNFTAGAAVGLAAGVWTQLSVAGAVAPAGAVYARLRVYTTAAGVAPAVGDTWDVTGALIEAAAAPGVYFDGTTTQSTQATRYSWAGTFDASASTQSTITRTVAPQTATTAFVENDGDEAAQVVYTVTGAVPQPIIQVSSGEYLGLTINLAATDTLVVDTDLGTVEVNGVSRYDAWLAGSTFPTIPPGGAEVSLRSGTGSTDQTPGLSITTAPRYR